MLNAIKEIARTHVLTTIITSALTGAVGGVGIYWSLYEARVNRIEEMKVEEFQSLVSEKQNFDQLLNAFTERLGTDDTVDVEKRQELSASLVRLYSGLGAFTINLSPEQERPVQQLQSSINEVKKHIQRTQSKQDLDVLGAALVLMYREFNAAQPVLEGAVGRQFAAST